MWQDHVMETTPSPEERAIAAWLLARFERGYETGGGACGCMGPRDGDPFCPCAMQWVVKIDGCFYQINRTYTPTGEHFTASLAAPKGAALHKTEYDVRLNGLKVTPAKVEDKIVIIKTIRELTGLGLAEAKNLFDSAPSIVKRMVSKADAVACAKRLEEAGGDVEIL